MSRNAIYDALLTIGAAVQINGAAAFAETGRRLKTPEQSQLPALFQIEPQETVRSADGLLRTRTFEVLWLIYHNTGADQSTVPASFSADVLDAIEAALAPPAASDFLTLGGNAYSAFIEGQVRRWEGDLDGITIMLIPLKVVVP